MPFSMVINCDTAIQAVLFSKAVTCEAKLSPAHHVHLQLDHGTGENYKHIGKKGLIFMCPSCQ